ncbi:hypothetical protein AYR66_06965 [Noviherbaspirillum denitrificans]|uniref:Uncharacterized protein n=1 Tax=Noviherbaspirillum denitrificans TaxID=1968433 RepID=A0A254T9F4_9BURK|nr:hypothetical protein AYR66_06965 [Noviherbaspirillum denitrificans]
MFILEMTLKHAAAGLGMRHARANSGKGKLPGFQKTYSAAILCESGCSERGSGMRDLLLCQKGMTNRHHSGGGYQAVRRVTTRRTQGATTATVGNAIGHVVAQLLSHCAINPAWMPRDMARTKAETMLTMMAESKALKRIGAKRDGIRMSFSWMN